MAKEKKTGDDLDWDQVFSKGAYCIGGGFMVGCGLSVLTSSTWPVLFSTGVGLGLACVNLENEMWNKGQRAVTFENPWLRVREKTSEDTPSRREEDVGEKIGRREKTRSMETPHPHWRQDQEPVPAVPLDKGRREAEHPEKEYTEREYPEKKYTEREYPEKEYTEREYREREYKEKEYKEKDVLRDLKPCPSGQKRKKGKSEKKEQVIKEKNDIEVEADPSLLAD